MDFSPAIKFLEDVEERLLKFQMKQNPGIDKGTEFFYLGYDANGQMQRSYSEIIDNDLQIEDNTVVYELNEDSTTSREFDRFQNQLDPDSPDANVVDSFTHVLRNVTKSALSLEGNFKVRRDDGEILEINGSEVVGERRKEYKTDNAASFVAEYLSEVEQGTLSYPENHDLILDYEPWQ